MSSGHPESVPPQTQPGLPGKEYKMNLKPQYDAPWYKGAGKLTGKVALITGGDSGIGRSVATLFAREGADVAIVYLKEEQKDADETKAAIEKEGRKCLQIPSDIRSKDNCTNAVKQTVEKLGRLDILVNNAAEQTEVDNFEDVPEKQIESTFRTNIFGMMFMTQAAIPHLREGSAIINTTSVVAYKGKSKMVDYASTKAAIVGFTYSMSELLVPKGIRVNAVAPGPIWTPLIVGSFDEDHVAQFGKNVPMNRPGQPEEVSPAYVFLAAQDSSYISGQVIHVNGGGIVGS